MKTLKKTLCLVLAVVMAVGVLVIPANAAFPDEADITHDEAVAVLNSLGILMGDDKGNLNPKETLTRAEAAVIVAKLAMTPDAFADYVASEVPFDDVAGTPYEDWAGSAIAYCAANGIIGGVGDNKFDPSGELTGTAFARMLLCAVGYKADKEGFGGDGWANAVENEARAQKLHSGITAFNYGAALSRDNAAQMAYNAMQVPMVVSYSGGTDIQLPGGVTITQGAERNQPEDGDTLADTYDVAAVTSADAEYDSESDDIFGRPAKYQVVVGDEVVYVQPISAVKTYTKGTNASTIAKDLKNYYLNSDKSAPINNDSTATGWTATANKVVNGGTPATITSGATTASTIAALTGNGHTVELYASTSDSKYIDTIVVIEPTAVKISDISASRVRLAKTDSYGAPAGVDVKKADDEDMYNLLAGMSEGDYLAVVLEGNNVLSAVALDTVTGKLTGTTSSSVTIDDQKLTTGKVYSSSANEEHRKSVSATNEYTALVDANNYVLDVVAASTGNTNAPVEMLYVVRVYQIYDEFNEPTQMFQGILPDGTVITGEYEGKAGSVTVNGQSETLLTGEAALNNKLVAYVVDDDVYHFYAKAAGTSSAGSLAFNTGVDSSATRYDGHYFSSSVVFISFTGTGNSLKVSTANGVQSIGTPADGNDFALVTKDGNGNYVITAVFVNGDSYVTEIDSDQLIYVGEKQVKPSGTGLAEDGKTTVNIYTVYINGEKTDIKVSSSNSTLTAGWNSFTVNSTTGIYTLTAYNDSEDLKGITKQEFEITAGKLLLVNDNYYMVDYKDSSTDTVANNAVVYDISGEDVAIESIEDLYALLQTEGISGVKIATVHSSNQKTVSVIYVTSQGEVAEAE